MYKKYFGFNENPFSIAPDPRYLYMSEMHQEALAHLNYGAVSDGCIILLTGEIGTGKTTICRCFLEQLDQATDVAIILNPKLTANELLGAICDEFEISASGPEPTVKNHIDRLNDYLLRAHAENRQALLVIDEAQNLEFDVLEMLRLLTNLETNKQKLLKIFLLGQSELLSILSRPDLTQISQRITSRYHLKGLIRDDMQAYINHRITVAGGGRARLFNRPAVKRIYTLSGGIPRLINSLCDRSLLGAYTEGKDRVNEKIVKKAAIEIFGKPEIEDKVRPRFRLLTATALLLASILAGYWFMGPKNGSNPPAVSEQNRVKNLPAAIKESPDKPAEETLPSADGALAALDQTEDIFLLTPEDKGQQNSDETEITRIIIEPIEIND
jgi:general secretion pathway protein A